MTYNFWTIAPIFLFPFCAFVINAFVGKKLPRQGDFVSVLAILASFVFSARIFGDFVFVKYSADTYVHQVFQWIDLSYLDSIFKINLGVYIDNMSAIMLLMVTGVASMIHLFSTWYMHGDVRYGKFFTLLSLFTSAMLGLVLSDNLFMLFIFWEIMGFCSYSLIGFYFEKEKAGEASLKAFMTTRIGDVIFLLGILAVWSVVGSVAYTDIYAAIANGVFTGKTILGMSLATFSALCIFAGTIGKSAQFPLQVWLPDAMMGPTPCSALIHAATMVAAGVYLSLRMFPLMDLGGITPFIALIGAITAFGAATIALVQTDIKAVLAYSTISQLGYMVIGVGVGSYNAAFMHVITHAVFKACLFLSAGSVIHAVHTQEMPQMGGLRKKLPYTFIAMLLCTLAIAGVPLFSGFVSKDRILGDALYFGMLSHGPAWYAIVPILGFAGAGLTAFYMFRLIFLTFFGEPRDHHAYDHCHHEHIQLNQSVPLLILAVFTLGVFFSGSLTGQGIIKIFPESKMEWFKVLVEVPQVEKFTGRVKDNFGPNSTESAKEFEHAHYHHQTGFAGKNVNEHELHHAHTIGAIASIIIAFLGIFIAYLMYISKKVKPLASSFPRYTKALQNRYYFDNFYIGGIIQKGLLPFNKFLAWIDAGVYDRYAIDGWAKVNKFFYTVSNKFDQVVIDRVGVDGTGTATNAFNLVLRMVQSGKIQFYFIVLIIVLGSYILSLNLV